MTRARVPDTDGSVDVDGVEIGYETFGDGGPTILLMPTSCIVHARAWKMQIPYLSRHYRVIAFDGPGNGRSSRPTEPQAYTAAAHVRYALAVLDRTGAEQVHVIAVSGGTHRALLLATDHSDRVLSEIFMGPSTPFGEGRAEAVMEAIASGDDDRFVRTFMANAFTEPHSTKVIEDGIEWADGITIPFFLMERGADAAESVDAYRAMCARIDCPVLVVQGTDDCLTPESHGRELVAAIGENARLVLIDGGGHRPDIRDPVEFSRIVRDFIPSSRTDPPTTWTRATARRRRALYISSPIGLGHARRDVAIAKELRALQPDLQIDWLAQDPVTRVLEDEGESIHPASRFLVSESAHMQSESRGHDLHCFEAWRRMDEILVNNFMVLHDVLENDGYDLVIGDEAWEADHFLHENPELKRGTFVWLTDFVGWLPLPDADDRERFLTADYNLEMIEHIDRYPWVRDRSIFVGNPDDIVPHAFGEGLPSIREWTEEHFSFSGYITGFEHHGAGRDALRAELGWSKDELVCVTAVGGSGVGAWLLNAAAAAYPLAKAKLPELRMLIVGGPRIEPATLAQRVDGLDVVGFVPDLHRYLAAADLAIIQGGLTTAMELVTLQRPFIYVPLGQHFEQQIHVPYRLDRYGAGRRMDHAAMNRELLANAIVEEMGLAVRYEPVESDGAKRAARMIAELL